MTEPPIDIENRFSGMQEMGAEYLSNPGNCVGLVLFKPDSVASRLDLPIEDFIKSELTRETGRDVYLFAYGQARLNSGQVREIYDEQRVEQYLKYIEDHLTSGPISFFLVLAENAPELLNKLKGSVRTGSGVRGIFSGKVAVSAQRLQEWKDGRLSPEETRNLGIELFAANLMHVPDDKAATKKIIRILYPEREVDQMKTSIPVFEKWLKGK